MFAIRAAKKLIAKSLKPPEDMDNASYLNQLKYNFMLRRESLKSYFFNHDLKTLSTQVQHYLPGNTHTPAGEFISDTELETPADIVLVDERGRLRCVQGIGDRKLSTQVSTEHLTPISIDSSTLIYFGGIGNRAIYPNVIEMDSQILNRIGSTANTLEKILLPAYELLEPDNPDAPQLPKRERLRKLGINAIYVYPYHTHDAGVIPFSDDDQHLKTLIWDYELLRLRQNPEGYFGREEQLFVENIFLPRIAEDIRIQDGKFVRHPMTKRIVIAGALATDKLLQNCRFTLVGYSLGADVIHRIRNCLVAYLRDLYPESVVSLALKQIVAITSCGANPILGSVPNFSIIRCVDIHDFGTLCRNPQFNQYPWHDLPAGTYRAVYLNPNKIICWMRTPYHENDRLNIGYHDEKFCLNPNYFPEIARNAIIKSASYTGPLPKHALNFLTVSHQEDNKKHLNFTSANSGITSKSIAIVMLIVMALTVLVTYIELIPLAGT